METYLNKQNMKANELRIGNLVEYSDGAGFVELCSLEIHKIDIGKVYVKPIPLTEEWLVRFGFRKTFDSPFEDFEWSDNNLQLSEKFDCYLGKFTQPIKYVHRLQNVYFALTGEELKLNDK